MKKRVIEKEINMWSTKITTLCLVISAAIMAESSSSSSSAIETVVHGGCSHQKFTPVSDYDSNLKSLFSSLVSSASLSRYANFTVPGGKGGVLYGLFQCRGDLDAVVCSACVSRAVAWLGSICMDASGGGVQLEGCLVRYDNVSFVGIEEKKLVFEKCGPVLAFGDQNAVSRLDDVMGSLGVVGPDGGPYRVGGAGEVSGVAQCVGDLSASECQDCLSEAIGRLRSDCHVAQWAYVYLAKCYARYSSHSHPYLTYESDNNKDHEDEQKTLAIVIGIVSLTLLLVIFLSSIGKQCHKFQDDM